MRLITFYITILSFLTTTLVAQNNPSELYFDVAQGESFSFTLSNDFQDPVVHYTASKGIVVETEISNGEFEVVYTADTDKLGNDVFSIQSIHFGGFFPTSELTVVHINIVKSFVTANDDFIFMDSNDPFEIYPLSNDESESESHALLDVTHVMYGEAIATDSNSILYTPSEKELDFINYTIIDDLGTSQQATIYIKKQQELLSESFQSYTISNSQIEYIFTEADDYVLTTDLLFGSIDQVADNVFKYTPNEDVEGIEVMVFETSDEKTLETEITIYDSYEDVGIIRDDIFYTSKENEIIFNVFENDFDNSLIINESQTSSELIYLGDGLFSYDPPLDYTGVKTFIYSATNGFITETGNIDVVVSNFVPASLITYQFEVLESSVLSIPYEIPLDGFSFEIASDPTFGSLSYISDNQSIATSCGDIIDQNTIVYSPFAGYEGMDEFDLLYCPDNNINPCELIKTRVTVLSNEEEDCNCISDCVWEGDANNDGLVDIIDVLTIGRNIGTTGPTRILGESWSGESCDDWDYNDNYGTNGKFADTNGDGLVTSDDLPTVISNYGNQHSYAANNNLSVKDYPFFLVPHSTEVEVGETMYIDILLGTETSPVIDLEGIAFSINLSSVIVDSSSVKVVYHEDQYFVNQSSFFDVVHQPIDGTIHTAAIRTNGSTSNGAGLIATLEFIVEEELDGVKPPKMRSASGGSYYNIDVLVSDITIQDGKGYKFTINPTNTNIQVELEEDKTNTLTKMSLYPNPSSSYVDVDVPSGTNSINLTDILGRTMISRSLSDLEIESGTVRLDLNTISDGFYHVTTYSEDSTQTKALQIAK